MAATLRNCSQFVKSIQTIKPNCRALSRAKNKKLRKAPPPPKIQKVSRHVFPHPKCIDIFSLRPEPYCIETGGACRSGNILVLLAGIALVGLGIGMSYSLIMSKMFASFEDDECDDQGDEE